MALWLKPQEILLNFNQLNFDTYDGKVIGFSLLPCKTALFPELHQGHWYRHGPLQQDLNNSRVAESVTYSSTSEEDGHGHVIPIARAMRRSKTYRKTRIRFFSTWCELQVR